MKSNRKICCTLGATSLSMLGWYERGLSNDDNDCGGMI